ncbi:hypothetical protein [Ruegeria arenilitoris]|uniref:hypothetical protein n=1 Tax=Ruegeria arenilitoris TaxID=1173585 RepID=UPI00147E755B|nr:hypothetical protein [Ruegeria arenilitoris]
MLDRQTLETLASERDVDALGISNDILPDSVIALLGFQRTKQISKQAREAWMAGNRAPLVAEVVERRSAIFNGALLEIFREHIPLRRYLAEREIRPKSIVDIGCGQALPTLFLLRDHSPKLTLVDIEHTDEQYHSWARSGSGYSSLAHARDLLVHNGADPREVETLNPQKNPNDMAQVSGDLVTSFYSCGFHYPVDDYIDLMVQTISGGGSVCLDLRKRYLRRRPAPLDRLLSAGRMVTLYEDPRSYRVVVTGL